MNVTILRNHTELCRALNAVIADKSVEQIKRDVAIKGSPANLMMRLLRVYHGAERRSERFGCIGVGCISFAENRVQHFQRRTLHHALARIRRAAAERMIGKLVREGKEVLYVFPAGGPYLEGSASELVSFLLRNEWV